MTKSLFSRRSLSLSGGLAVLLTGLAVSPALASTKVTLVSTGSVNTSACSDPALSQPFLSAGDSNWYTLAPGQTSDNFSGGGWTLTGGARIIATQLQDANTGSVLDLPSGSTAVSPPMCVDSDYPTARAMIRDVVGSQGVHTYVSYAGTNTAATPEETGRLYGSGTGWTVSDAVKLQPGNLAGWELVQFTLVPGGLSSEFRIYDFYVDPRMSG
jgi:hypothetical protein